MKRILQVVGRMDRAGQETFLMNVFRSNPDASYKFIFSVNTEHVGDYEEEIVKAGGIIWHNPYAANFQNLCKYLKAFRSFLQREGPFDVIHCHVYYFSCFLLREAAKCGIPVRIMHSHNTSDGYGNNPLRKIYRRVSMHMIKKYATNFVACGEEAYNSFFGLKCPDKSVILNNAIIPDNFNFASQSRITLRNELGINQDSEIIISIARFSEVKNHKRIILIFNEVLRLKSNSVLLLVGEGELRNEIEGLCRKLGILEKVKFLGIRNDIPYLLNASNVLLMPSLFEGLPVTLIEAQAAGIPCVISSSITDEVDMNLNLINFIDLVESDKKWAISILNDSKKNRPLFEERIKQLRKHGYVIERTWEKLKNIYESQK